MVKKYLDNNLLKGFIRSLSLSISLLVILVKKLGSRLRVYVDYYTLNTVTIKNRYSLLKIRKTLD